MKNISESDSNKIEMELLLKEALKVNGKQEPSQQLNVSIIKKAESLGKCSDLCLNRTTSKK